MERLPIDLSEQLIPGPIEILVGSDQYDLMIEIDITSDDFLFDFVPNHLRQMPCVSSTHTITIRRAASFPTPPISATVEIPH